MKKRLSFLFTFSFIAFVTIFLMAGSVFADYADGTYNIPFEMKESGSENTSIADGYFSKPAKLIVKNGNKYVQLTITNSEWVKDLSGPYGKATVVSENKANDIRTVQLQVGDLTKPVTLKMHVVVPEDIAGMHYDHEHTVRAAFDVSNVPAPSSSETKGEATKSPEQGGTQQTEVNPPTNDTTPIGLYVALLTGSLAVFIIYRLRLAKN